MTKKDNTSQMNMRHNAASGMKHGGERVKDLKGTVRKLLKYLKPFRYNFILVLIFALFSTVFSIFGPKILGEAIDKLYNTVIDKLNHIPNTVVDYAGIAKILLFLLFIYFLSALFNYLQEYLMSAISQKMIQQMRNDVNAKLNHLPLKFFDTKTHGEILSRVTNDIDTISSTFQQSLIQIITSAITLIGITIMMLVISPVLSLIAFLMLPLSFLVSSFIAKKSQKYYVGQQTVLGKLNGYVEEMYGGHSIVKAFNFEEKSIDEFVETNDNLFNQGWKAQFASSIIYPTLNFLSNLTFIGVCVLGGYLVASGRMTLGSVQAFISYSRQFNQPIMQVTNIVNVFQATVAAAERVFEILSEKEEIPDIANPLSIKSPKGAVVFDNISFRYQPDKPLIDNLSIDVKSGQVIAIVGPTGAGKTTLVNLLMRFYELDGGSISVDSINITDMTRKGLHSLFGMVLQDSWLFKGTIRENIAYGKKGATDEEIIHAAEIALADSFIRTLPDGYDTLINEEGTNISQGQKQLLTIARAIVANPPIMILDEATSSVDTRTEVLIQKAMSRLMQNRTSFVIAHRLSTIREADCILVMNEGRIVEKGTHQELLHKNGFYANLYYS